MMLQYGYQKELSCGAISASGTLGILIPPSIMLVVMANQATISVGKLFAGAVFPGVILSVLYLAYIFIRCWKNPKLGPAISKEELAGVTYTQIFLMVMKSLVPPMILVMGVLGSIFAGIATPTEASGVGAFLAFLMVVAYGKFSWAVLKNAAISTVKINTMVIFLLCGATCFTGVFLGIGGGDVVTGFVLGLGLGKWGIFWVMMAIVFILGMFIDWIGIVLICFPLFLPIAKDLGFDLVWFVVMIAVNLQASFLTPPFGYALFYIKGVAPQDVTLMDIYRGIVPFVLLMIIGLVLCAAFPNAVLWLPSLIVN
jgi:tripartite ATP-independent transporter DctM subunit